MAKVVEGFVNFIGDSKKGDGKGMFVSGQDGWINISSRVDTDELKKGCKVKVKIVNGKAMAVKVLAQPRAGGGGRGGRGGGGYKNDPAVQRSIVMQHSQDMAVSYLGVILSNNGIKLGPKTKPEAIKALLDATLDEYVAKFYEQAAGEGPQEFIDERSNDEDDTENDDDFDEEDESEDDDDFDDEDDF